ncbi:hypothetical protein T492DRAFT_850389 [Pavlovales sp. CCMP2436]|nr:hypothetical protein T492DRAFT_850389 [Pavlovales sp. CCMP2436]
MEDRSRCPPPAIRWPVPLNGQPPSNKSLNTEAGKPASSLAGKPPPAGGQAKAAPSFNQVIGDAMRLGPSPQRPKLDAANPVSKAGASPDLPLNVGRPFGLANPNPASRDPPPNLNSNRASRASPPQPPQFVYMPTNPFCRNALPQPPQ